LKHVYKLTKHTFINTRGTFKMEGRTVRLIELVIIYESLKN